MLSACGGGGGSSTSASPATTANTADPIPANYLSYQNLCAAPRTGVDAEGKPFPDRQGTLQDEMKFLRGWTDATYLWYNEVPGTVHMADFTNTLDYFDALKTPAKTASGRRKDQFHFTYTTAEWDAMSLRSEDTGYGVTWSVNSLTAPRNWRVAIVEPGSPAAAAGLQRGDVLATIDGVDFINTNDQTQIDKTKAGLYPATAGESHTFTVQRNGAIVTAALTSAVVTSTPVKNVKVLDTPTGKVGYLSFEDHNAVAEQQLISAFTNLKSQGVTDLVLDMRYNGGGYLYIASELAYMVAGPGTAGKTFEQLIFNDKTTPEKPTPFYNGVSGTGTPLPYLGLKHVTVLTSSDTCSASESVINGLRGVDVQVDLIGGATCGKPYGFMPEDNCGTTYFSIQFRGVNAKGFGDYADGFTPTCNVSDDMAHALGDLAEGMLAAALSYRTSNACPAATAASVTSVPTYLARSPLKKIAIYSMSTRMRTR
ncbi:MAG: PDZ domain-containing protein [Massilia sp.]|nr:PDZ domain-containing protein [Massilia sp.]